MQKEYSAINKKAAVASILIAVVLIAAACVFSEVLSGKQFYYPMAVLIMAAASVPFIASFEKRRPSARELVLLACMSALAVASRAAFYAFPTIKPMCAIVIITAVCFGAQTGFVCGVLSMFVSNFIFGQGIWTPFQMLAMGTVGLLAGLIFSGRKLKQNRFALALVGGLLCFAVYGLIVDLSSVLMMTTEFSLKQIAAIYASGIAYNFSHGVTTAVILFVAGKIFIEKLDRIKIKYGMFQQKEQ